MWYDCKQYNYQIYVKQTKADCTTEQLPNIKVLEALKTPDKYVKH